MRYASLHRTVEAGLATDKTWAELCHVCLELDKPDEARKAYDQIEDTALRLRFQRKLVERRVLEPPAKTKRTQPQPVKTTFRNEISDSFRFLFLDHMPMTVIAATVMFPLVVGLGGFLTQGSNVFLLPLIALIPGLTVLGLVGALGRRILVDASRGLDDPPAIPEARHLFREAGRFLLDSSVLTVLLVGPGLAVLWFELVSPFTALPTIGAGLALLPIAIAIRQLRNDWSALSPRVLLGAVASASPRYLAVAVLSVGLFLPAVLSGFITIGSPLYLQIAVVGPLSVAPLFITMRLLGRVLDLQRHRLTDLLGLEPKKVEPNLKTVREHARSDAKQKVTAARVRKAVGQSPHPEVGRPAAQTQRKPAQTQRKPAQTQRKPAQTQRKPAQTQRKPAQTQRKPAQTQRKPAQRKPAPKQRKPVGKRRPPARPQPARNAPPEPVQPTQHIVGDAPPDLTELLPGATILRGKARVIAGASALTDADQD